MDAIISGLSTCRDPFARRQEQGQEFHLPPQGLEGTHGDVLPTEL